MELPIFTRVLICACLTPLGAVAAERPRFDVTPMVGYRMGGEFEEADTETDTGRTLDLDEGTDETTVAESALLDVRRLDAAHSGSRVDGNKNESEQNDDEHSRRKPQAQADDDNRDQRRNRHG